MRGTRKDYTFPTRFEVLNLVQEYLDGAQRESKRGDFAEVKENDIEEIDAIILALVKYRYAPDADGDRPIRWSLCDWTREDPHSFVNLPKIDDDYSNIDQVLDKALHNLSIANEAVQHVGFIRKFRMVI